MDFTIADRLVALRREHGYSQESLAAELGLTRQAVSRWERGESLPDTENLIALADLYEITLDEIVRPQVVEPDDLAEPSLAQETEGVEDGTVFEETLPSKTASATRDEAPSPHLQLDEDAALGEGAWPLPAQDSSVKTGPEMPSIDALPHSFETPKVASTTSHEPAPAETGEAPKKPTGGILIEFLVGCLVMLTLGAAVAAGGCMLFGAQRVTGGESVAEYSDDAIYGQTVDPDLSTKEVYVDPEQVSSLDIDWAAGSVDVIVSDANSDEIIVMEQYLDEGAESTPMVVNVRNGELAISYGKKGLLGMMPGKGLKLYLPGYMALEFDKVGCDIASGSLNMADLSCRELELDLASGTINVRDVTADRLDVDVASGDAKVSGSFARELEMELASGKLRVATNVMPAETDVDVASGDAILELPSDANFTAAVDKTSGTFTLDFDAKQEGDTYTVGTGGSLVRVDLASGSLHIR